MPGDPIRAKYIAEKYLDNYTLVNDVRGMYAYTGMYKQKELTIMAHGMGIPSIGIYSYELFKFYNVENIIRIGSCGGYKKELELFDIILSDTVFSESNYALTLNNDICHTIQSSDFLDKLILNTSKELNLNIYHKNTVTTDCFDVYMTDVSRFLERVPKDFDPYSAEMEAFSLLYNAKLLNKNASCLMSVVDSKYIDKIATIKEREQGLDNMITLALESAIKIQS